MTNPTTPPESRDPGQGQPETPQPFVPQQGGYPPQQYPQQPYPHEQYPQQAGYSQQPYPQQAGYPQQPYPQQPFPQQGPPVYQPVQSGPAQEQFPQQSQHAPARAPRPKADASGVPYGIGPFTLREVLFLGATAVVFLASFLPFLGGDYAELFGYSSAWAPAPWLAIPAALVLVSAAALILMRRMAPGRSLRVGSLSVDQFASAASVVTAGFYLGALFLILGFPAWFGGGSEILAPGAGVIVGLLFSLAAVVVTTLAPVIPPLNSDFTNRKDAGAHRVARPADAVPRRPRPEQQIPREQPQQYPAEAGFPLQQAGPGEFAAYQRRGSASAVPAEEYVPSAEQRADLQSGDRPAVDDGIDERTIAGQPVRPPSGSAEEVPQVPAERTAAVPFEEFQESENAREAQADDEIAVGAERDERLPGESQAFAPGFVASDVPAVDPEPATAIQPGDVDDERADEVSAPMSAFSHVSARSAAGRPASGDPSAEPVAEAEPVSTVHDDAQSEHTGTHPGEPEHSEPAARAQATPDEITPEQAAPVAASPTAVFSTQPFWVYSPVPRPVVDEVSGATVFEIGPTAWALAVVDRGSELVIRHDDGRIGVLHDLDGITRG